VIVITKVSEPETGGNLATALVDLWVRVEDGNEANGWLGKFIPGIKALGSAALDLYTPVFRVGEVLELDENDRDQFGRKPDKWDVSYETFDTAEEAFRRAKEVNR
jgi:hypothetical protein